MNEFTSKSINRKKYFIWSLFAADDDDDANGYNIFKIHEFRVCDCYLDWILQFQFKNKDVVFSTEFATAFFDEIPLHGEGNDCDIFAVFGKISIVCCERALYHFCYKKDIQHEKIYNECLTYDTECNCTYSLHKKNVIFFSLFKLPI